MFPSMIVQHNYVKYQYVSSKEVVFKVAFTCNCLKSWYNFKKNNALAISCVEILNAFLEEKYGLKLKISKCKQKIHFLKLFLSLKVC